MQGEELDQYYLRMGCNDALMEIIQEFERTPGTAHLGDNLRFKAAKIGRTPEYNNWYMKLLDAQDVYEERQELLERRKAELRPTVNEIKSSIDNMKRMPYTSLQQQSDVTQRIRQAEESIEMFQ